MDINVSMVSGRLAAAPLVEHHPDGSVLARMLVLVRSDKRSRIDVIPVTMANPPFALLARNVGSGTAVYMAGELTRRCEADLLSTSTSLEMVADSLAMWTNDR